MIKNVFNCMNVYQESTWNLFAYGRGIRKRNANLVVSLDLNLRGQIFLGLKCLINNVYLKKLLVKES